MNLRTISVSLAAAALALAVAVTTASARSHTTRSTTACALATAADPGNSTAPASIPASLHAPKLAKKSTYNVAFSQNNQWQYVTWDSGTATQSGLIWGHPIYASGVAWQDQVISEDFFDVSSSSLIWGLRGYACYESGLIWGFVNVLVWGIF